METQATKVNAVERRDISQSDCQRLASTPYWIALNIHEIQEVLETHGERLDMLPLKDSLGWTFLHWQAFYGNTPSIAQNLQDISPHERFQLLRMQGDRGGRTPLHVAASCGYTETIGVIVEAITPNEFLHLLNITDACGRTALHVAAFCGQAGALKRILDAVPSKCSMLLQIEDKDGKTAIRLAAEKVHADSIVNMLVSCNTMERFQLLSEETIKILQNAGVQNLNGLMDILTQLTEHERHQFLSKRRGDERTFMHMLLEQNHIDRSLLGPFLSLLGKYASKLLEMKDRYKIAAYEVPCSREISDILNPYSPVYRLHGAPTALVFYTTHGRDGAVEESITLMNILTELGFKTHLFSDFTKEILLEAINNVCDKSDISALMVVTMSHGDKGVIFDQLNQPLQVQQIITALSSKNIKDVPKILIMQACRISASSDDPSGNQSALTVSINAESPSNDMKHLDAASGQLDAKTTGETTDTFYLTHKDFLVACAALHGRPARRNFFIPLLSEYLKEAEREEELYQTLVKINQEMQRQYSDENQVLEIISTLSKSLFMKKF